ncbi:hypothetical protein [Natrinema sp. DC36]|uniref:hypothetical protein n=1 Tax=Natrinema sp. DC36 TaxID=2878680 RepID=UPI001CF05502|nr:hypothetical protein [Natrinema sp. DC36]
MAKNNSGGSDGEDATKPSRRQLLLSAAVGVPATGGFLGFLYHKHRTDEYDPTNFYVQVTDGKEYLNSIDLVGHGFPTTGEIKLKLTVRDSFETDTVYLEIHHDDHDPFVDVARDLPATSERGYPLQPKLVAGEYTVQYYDHNIEETARAEEEGSEAPGPVGESAFTITHNP